MIRNLIVMYIFGDQAGKTVGTMGAGEGVGWGWAGGEIIFDDLGKENIVSDRSNLLHITESSI